MKKLFKPLLLLFTFIFLSACSTAEQPNVSNNTGTSSGQAGESNSASGEFVLYTSQPEEDINKLVAAFNKEYPDIKVNIFRSGTEEVISKVMAEKETGEVLADALLVSDSFTFDQLANEDLLQSYESPELDKIPSDYVHPDFKYAGTKLIVTGMAVNTDMVDANEIDGFKSMTDTKYKGMPMIPSPLYSGAASLNLSILTQDGNLGWDFYEDLKANDVFVGQGNGTVRDALLNGQQGMGMLVDYMAIRAKNDGAPIEFVYPEEGALYVTEPIGIINGAKNAELAQHFVDFILSERGQEVTAEIGYTPVREGVQAPEGLKGVSDIKTMDYNSQQVLETRDADKEKFAELFGQ
ncbi:MULTISPECIES: ABC transporter substrate-binding protein [Aerococcus]|uniref:ABC transporter substrate-binding protein n=1 Tax=Aerococcus TaxID=1375 RepID=UPI000DCF0FA7|nr:MULTISPECIES: ABC transporter substrate-binding protein [Aerococcus]KAA9297511.1 ABC transporter substrate-binding protein [Aerococcus tenax]MDK6688175.1 ABC transporter substrate-binding protein [Aerococcus urinae]MDK8132705.1 ABC transporter substrate-binding protein [Aerococcus urinae]MDK8484374.1 ABC transporter substrate-binding protein [Aerococcus urinae]MDL5179343.1 ABC transporter substrate-binding protein [Aerococcus tenax]